MRFDPKDIENVRARAFAGRSINQIVSHTGLSRGDVLKICQQNGYTINGKIHLVGVDKAKTLGTPPLRTFSWDQ